MPLAGADPRLGGRRCATSGQEGRGDRRLPCNDDLVTLPVIRDTLKRSMRTGSPCVGLMQDARHALRRLRRHPGFWVASTLTLGLGVGTTTAVASLTDAVLFKPRPGVHDPAQLIALYTDDRTTISIDYGGLSYPHYLDLRDDGGPVDLAVFLRHPFILTGDGVPTEVIGDFVSGSYFTVLQTVPAVGRLLTPVDDRPGASRAVVISHRLWHERFDGTPAVIGDTITLNDEPWTIVGVAPEGFRGTSLDWYGESSLDVFVPMASIERHPTYAGRSILTRRQFFSLTTIGRRRLEVTMETARAALTTRARRWGTDAASGERDLLVRPATQSRFWPGRYAGNVRLLALLNGSAALLLAVTGFNLATLWLTRALPRRREMAVRLALGAGRLRLGRQQLVEAVIVAVGGAAVGAVSASVFLGGLSGYPAVFQVPLDLALEPDGRMLALAFALSTTVAVVCVLIPALTVARGSLSAVLQDGGPTVGGSRSVIGRQVLLVAQVAVSVVVLVTAGVLGQSVYALSQIEPGYDPDGVWVASIDGSRPADVGAETDELGLPIRLGLLDHVQAMPEVGVVSAAAFSPLSRARPQATVTAPGSARQEPSLIVLREVGARYFDVLRLPLIRGSDFTATSAAADEAIVNQALGTLLWPGRDPIGQVVRVRGEDTDRRVTGVVANAAHRDLLNANEPYMYLPVFRRPQNEPTVLVIRSQLAPPDFAERLRAAVATISDQVVVGDVRSLDAEISAHLSRERLAATVAVLFGGMVVVLVAVGIFGLFMVIVQRRAREFGIRMALGADSKHVRRHVLGQVARLTLIGVGTGVTVWFGLHTVVASEVYGVASNDPLTVGVVAAVVVLMSLGAAAIPASRAGRTEPMVILRSE